MRRNWRVLGTLALLLALIPALAFASARSLKSPVPSRPPAPPVNTTLRLALPDTSATVDPSLVADEENVQLASLLYSGLVRLDDSYHVVLDAAQRYTVSADHRTYTFFLRNGLKFSNGDPVTAQDYRYSINRSLNPALKSPSAPTYLLDIQGALSVLEGKAKTASGIRVLDDHTLQIVARWPVPYFLMELTYPTSFALDSKRIAKYGAPDNTVWYANPVGSGPYRLKSWIPNVKMVLTRNAHYAGVRPSVKTITVELAPLPSQGVDLYNYVSHALDVVSLPSFDAGLLKQPGIHETKMLAIAGIYFNIKSKPFNNPHVRRALSLALNRSALVSHQMGSAVTPFGGFVPPGEAGYDTRLQVLPFDVARAQAELALGGYAGGKKFPSFTLYYGVDANNPPVAQLLDHLAAAMSRAWQRNLNISVDTHQLTLNTLYAKAQSNALPVYLSGWSADYPDAHDWLSAQWRTKAPNNNVAYSDPHFDAAVETADVTWSGKQRLALYDQAQQILVDDAAWIPLYIPHRLVYIRPTVSNLVLTGYGLIPRTGSWARVEVHAAAPAKGFFRQ